MPTTLIKYLPQNLFGRDFVVGDIHGCFHIVEQALKLVEFDPNKDRLLCVGDMIDRGPFSAAAEQFIKKSYVNAICGNHEIMLVEMYRDGPPHPAALKAAFSRNGMEWLLEITEEERQRYALTFSKLPIAIEVPTRRGIVGLVHADVPFNLSWQEFTAILNRGDTNHRVIQAAVWGRDRINNRDPRGVRGIDRVFVGHTPIDFKSRLGNVYFVDTGAVFGWAAKQPSQGHMSIAELTVGTALFDAPPAKLADGIIDIALDYEQKTKPFGIYAST